MTQTFSIPIESITYDDKTRQRQELPEIPELAASIERLGQLNPVILDRENKLIAGRRRLEACRQLGYTTILARYHDSLSQSDRQLVELDENIRRVDITWQEKAAAILGIFELRGGEETLEVFSGYIGLSETEVQRCLSVGKALRQGEPAILAAVSLRQAAELLSRRRKLAFDTALSRFEEEDFHEQQEGNGTAGSGDGPNPVAVDRAFGLGQTGGTTAGQQPVSDSLRPAERSPYSIIAGDFIQFARGYVGPKFNFIHCDFPYGIGFDSSDAARTEGHESNYKDSEETFWALTEALLQNQDRLVLPSAHMLFWFSMRYYDAIRARLESANWTVCYLPLVWHKSDGAGIAADFKRRPKHVYETALWCSRGDRLLLQLRNDVFAHPIVRNTEGHLSAKPQAMLEYFLSMGVGELSDFLDPTCGSGTSIRAAAALGARRALGIELNPEIAQGASLKLNNQLKETKKDA